MVEADVGAGGTLVVGGAVKLAFLELAEAVHERLNGAIHISVELLIGTL